MPADEKLFCHKALRCILKGNPEQSDVLEKYAVYMSDIMNYRRDVM